MKSFYMPITVASIILFAIWIYLRHQIWTNSALYPDERLMIYTRDGSAFYASLRIFFVAMWAWAAYLLWIGGKSLYMWVIALCYASFLILDNLVLGHYYLQYKAEYDNYWEASLPLSAFRGIPEAVLTMLGNLFASSYLKKSRLKRLIFESSPPTLS